MKIVNIAVSELVFDPNIYPRASGPSTSNIAQLAEALRAGETLPPIVATKKTRRLVDGVNRWRAWRRVHGPDSKIPCEIVEEEDDRELFVLAVKQNTAHGLGLSQYDRTASLVRMEQLGVTREVALTALRITAEFGERIEAKKTAYRKGDAGQPEKVALKGAMHGFRGETLSKRQERANLSAGGMKPEYYCNQMISLVEAGIIAKASASLLQRLRLLKELLNATLPANKKKSA